MPYAVTHVETLHAGWTKLLRATVRFPDGRLVRREVEDHGAAVAVLPYDPDRRVAMLISQFRTPPLHAAGEAAVLEAPAGLLYEGDPEAGARREALEETGLRLGGLEPVALVWTMPGISTERMHLFLAPYAEGDRVAAGGGVADENEAIEVAEMPLAVLARRADEGGLGDLKTLLLVQTLRLRRPDLFTA
jgi:nudix-type nucleoside diphosphatase (YffH/AdpP family)